MIPFFSHPGCFEGCRDVAAIGVPGREELPPDWLVAQRYEPSRLSMPTGIRWQAYAETPRQKPPPIRYLKIVHPAADFTPARIFYLRS